MGLALGSIFGLRSDSKLQEFEQYLLKEYENIAEAHFKTIEAISSFFRYYLIIMALPFTLYSAIIGLSPQMGQFIFALAFLAALVSLIIALVGFFVLLYVVNLRMDVILYARTVNAIRKHFYDNADLDINSKLRLRTLPQTPSLPAYFEPLYFLPVTISFAIFNMVYLSIGLILFLTPLPEISNLISLSSILGLIKDVPLWIWFAAPLFFVGHLMGYYLIARHRELSYLRSYAIGVDIDGVLNEHRPHFCDLLWILVHKQLDPDSITKIPVHEEPSLGISEDDEKRVFNDPRYWTEMPCAKSSALSIRKSRNALKLKVHIFTYRPWPSEETRQEADSRKEWENAAILMYKKSDFVLPRLLHQLRGQRRLYGRVEKVIDQFLTLRMRTKNVRGLGLRPINIITKCWLQHNGIEYDTLTIERGSEDVSDPQGHFRNRFYISRKKKLRFFVEDDHEKASKLAYICDLVFLVEHPYNEKEEVPNNVLRVRSWDEIYRQVRRHS